MRNKFGKTNDSHYFHNASLFIQTIRFEDIDTSKYTSINRKNQSNLEKQIFVDGFQILRIIPFLVPGALLAPFLIFWWWCERNWQTPRERSLKSGDFLLFSFVAEICILWFFFLDKRFLLFLKISNPTKIRSKFLRFGEYFFSTTFRRVKPTQQQQKQDKFAFCFYK